MRKRILIKSSVIQKSKQKHCLVELKDLIPILSIILAILSIIASAYNVEQQNKTSKENIRINLAYQNGYSAYVELVSYLVPVKIELDNSLDHEFNTSFSRWCARGRLEELAKKLDHDKMILLYVKFIPLLRSQSEIVEFRKTIIHFIENTKWIAKGRYDPDMQGKLGNSVNINRYYQDIETILSIVQGVFYKSN